MQKRWVVASVHLMLNFGLAVNGQATNGLEGRSLRDSHEDEQACNKWYTPPVEHICHSNYPGWSDKLWIILFSSQSCVQCKRVEKGFANWAKKLKRDPSVRVGVVNCHWKKNYRKLCYPRHSVNALPALRFVQNGEIEVPQGYKHFMEEIDALITTKLSSRACPEDSHALSSSLVVPLCRNRFPWGATETTWMVVYYTKSSAESLMKVCQEVSEDLGATATAGQDIKQHSMKKRDQLSAIQSKYSFTLDVPEQGFLGYDPLVNVGALCCDCDSEQEVFCKEVLDASQVQPPAIEWFENGQRRDIESGDASQLTSAALMEYALEHLGVMQAKEEL